MGLIKSMEVDELLSLIFDGVQSVKIDAPSSPRLLTVRKVSALRACVYNQMWHSRLPNIHYSNVVRNRHYICFDAMYMRQCYAVGIWSSPVNQNFDMDTVLELRRFAISPKAPKYTASYMLGKMIKLIREYLPMITRLISYQDTEVHTGTIYKASNWKAVTETKYVPWDVSRERNVSQSTANKIRWEYHLS